MRKFLIFSLLVSFLSVSTASADTIHLKNGSVLKGKVASFADDQFVVMLDTGSGRYMSRAMIYIGDVTRIEFDTPSGGPNDPTPARETTSSARDSASHTAEPAPRDAQPSDPQPRNVNPPDAQPASLPARNPEVAQPERTVNTSSAPSTDPPAASETNEPAARKMTGPVRTTSIDVVAKRDWTSTGLIVKRGDRLRITASGSITIDPASGQASGPEGSDLPDAKKLMADRPTGALIGVIGADNDDFIFIGGQAEFTARRDGLLFLSVNEGTLSDNAGAYKAVIELQTQR
ncbi:MAG TPA: hypothetical protein VNH22_20445 [Blastocatellia bacterium]|jgi:sRNA-binding regulator protein Hfq|nr:hypothetical protein [Blastocatellia bacterium]